ncbi:phage protein Gp27 family protein [Acinetobacter dispersus]|uniref:phage protein Gp27 family protein n=1 Tax=Acinetobacter dispersus TaxID=70348 RepID=UPI00132F1BDD|nr:phage protein Gp27 family protein [Acinetobacter dispersus]QHH96703.1 DUF3486 family protein [Acinetobacter dispersus]
MRKISDDARKYLESLLREDRYTIDDLMDMFGEKFPDEAPARSTMGRTKKKWDEEAQALRNFASASEVLVKELGHDIDDKGGMLLAQAVQAIVTNVALNELTNSGDDPEKPKMNIDDVGQLARAARAAMMTKSKATENREDIRRLAREELLKEQDENLKKAAISQGLGAEQLQFWREKVLGIK